ncbi:acyl-CoA synthetase [Stenotrophobium rhamnosiphilum]|uniref:Fatty-acid--CoA ligase n=1 Tax=Stenotrophobium rhamnosiphilum TaxID=2029166 RepID=A0A2T5MH28_9GAMM|nr:long-chain fatty acid--CoA ligase [Stenotrophobium rhamnosiphilum]PTU31870.1 fatty-acid--CoA ligase [Stenotrophobium rhamnosiphilum]
MASTYLTQALHRAKALYPSRTATIYGGRRRTYAEFVDRVARLAAGLRQVGVMPGDRVGVLAQNSDRYIELYYAVWWTGAVINPCNTRWSPREIAYSLDDSKTSVLVVDDTFAPMVDDLAKRSDSLRTLIYAGDREAPAGMHIYEQLILDCAPMADALRSNEDLAGIFYTGGTTGFPKGVMLTHSSLWSSTVTIAEMVAPFESVGLHSAPMFHLADGAFILALTLRGGTHVAIPGFDPNLVVDVIPKEKVTVTLMVPTMIQMLVDHPKFDPPSMKSLTQIIYGASPISEALLYRAMDGLPETKFTQAYGLTEMSPVISFLGSEHHVRDGKKIRSAGQPAFSVEVRIVDPEGNEVPRGTVGEISARGPGVMQGYWGKPDQTAAALRDGWLLTGDGAYMDDDGFIFVVDRVKDMIVSGGENVYSAEVENAVAQHPAVASCAVIGIPNAQWGEAVHAVIVCAAGVEPPTCEEIRNHCRDLIATYKCPRSIEIKDALPLSGAGKVLKTVLREHYWKEQERKVG